MANIIFIVNVNKPNYSKYCIESWKVWSKSHDSEVIVLDEPFSNIEPHWYKVFVFDLLESSNISAERVLVVDNDTIVNPQCPNFFNLVPKEDIGVVLDDVNYDWTIRSTDAYHKHCFSEFYRFDPFLYFNSGFIVLSAHHREVYSKVVEFLTKNYNSLNWVQSNYGVGRDQTPLNFLLRHYTQLQYLSKKFNLQGLYSKEIIDPEMLLQMAYVYHFNAMPRDHRNTLMQKVYNHHYE